MNRKRIVYVGFAFSHHGKYAGYNQIKGHITYDKIINCQGEFNKHQWLRQHRNLLTRLYFKIFGSRLWITECKLIILSLKYPNNLIFHIIYGENIYKYLGFFKRGNEIVLTLHQPPTYFLKHKSFWLRALKKVDKIIVMSRDMEFLFVDWSINLPVKYIPHGINTSRFVPAGEKQDQLLMVGNWLRDFDFASQFFEALKRKLPNIRIIVLTDRQNHSHFDHLGIELLSRISDDELLALYQTSKILFLPLKDFTGNNALLEACSTGCQAIISTDKANHIDDPNSPVLFIKRNIPDALNEVERVLNAYSPKDEIKLRNYITGNFAWEEIGDQTERFILG